MTKINIEIDLASLLNEEEKSDALFSALLQSITSNHVWLASVLKTSVIERVMDTQEGVSLINAVTECLKKKIESVDNYSGLSWDVYHSEAYQRAISLAVQDNFEAINATAKAIIADETKQEKLIEQISWKVAENMADAFYKGRNA